MLLCYCCSQNIIEPSSFWKDFLPLVSPFVVILLFIIDRRVGFILRKKEIERNWYLKVLIEPSISKISEFYKNSLDYYSSSAKFLESNKTILFPHEYNSIQSKEFGKFQLLKRELEAEVIFPIQMRYNDVGKLLTESLLNLEDNFTKNLDNKLFSENDIKNFQIIVANNRAVFLTHLYLPLQQRGSFSLLRFLNGVKSFWEQLRSKGKSN